MEKLSRPDLNRNRIFGWSWMNREHARPSCPESLLNRYRPLNRELLNLFYSQRFSDPPSFFNRRHNFKARRYASRYPGLFRIIETLAFRCFLPLRDCTGDIVLRRDSYFAALGKERNPPTDDRPHEMTGPFPPVVAIWGARPA